MKSVGTIRFDDGITLREGTLLNGALFRMCSRLKYRTRYDKNATRFQRPYHAEHVSQRDIFVAHPPRSLDELILQIARHDIYWLQMDFAANRKHSIHRARRRCQNAISSRCPQGNWKYNARLSDIVASDLVAESGPGKGPQPRQSSRFICKYSIRQERD